MASGIQVERPLCDGSHARRRPEAVGYYLYRTQGGMIRGIYLCAECRKSLDWDFIPNPWVEDDG